MTVRNWEPIRDLVTLREAMDRLFEESFVRPGSTRWARADLREGRCQLPLDAYVTANELIIVASVPGLSPDEVEITIEGDTLSLQGEIAGPIENVEYIIQQRPYGKFSRTLRLNIPVDADAAEASFEHGVLVLTIPKAEEAKPRTIKVKTK
jgi:HSP20 family protein